MTYGCPGVRAGTLTPIWFSGAPLALARTPARRRVARSGALA